MQKIKVIPQLRESDSQTNGPRKSYPWHLPASCQHPFKRHSPWPFQEHKLVLPKPLCWAHLYHLSIDSANTSVFH